MTKREHLGAAQKWRALQPYGVQGFNGPGTFLQAFSFA